MRFAVFAAALIGAGLHVSTAYAAPPPKSATPTQQRALAQCDKIKIVAQRQTCRRDAMAAKPAPAKPRPAAAAQARKPAPRKPVPAVQQQAALVD